MFTRKTRTIVATVATALAVAVVPASSQALRAQPTGDRSLDDYCSKAAALIDKALTQANLALVDGRDDDFDAWSALAVDMIKRSKARGCEFTSARKIRRILSAFEVGATETSSEPSVGTSPEGSGGIPPRSLDGGSPQVSGLAAP